MSAVVRPTVFALLIIIAAYLPIFLLQRVEGRIFAPMAHTVVAALLGSLIFSITLVPVLAALAYRRGVTHRESPVQRVAMALYVPTLRAALSRPQAVIFGAILWLLGAAYVLAGRGSEFLPELNEGALYLTFTLPANASLNEGRRMVPRLTGMISEFPQVELLSSQLGRPEDGTDARQRAVLRAAACGLAAKRALDRLTKAAMSVMYASATPPTARKKSSGYRAAIGMNSLGEQHQQ